MVFKFRVLSGDSDGFARDYEISDDCTLWDLHDHIQDDLGFDSDQMASFFTVDDDWNKLQEYTLFDMGEESDSSISIPIAMDRAVLSNILLSKNQKLLYTFDIFNDRGLFLDLIEIKNAEKGIVYPITTFAIGDGPAQIEIPKGDTSVYDDVMEDFDDFESYEEYNDRSDDEF